MEQYWALIWLGIALLLGIAEVLGAGGFLVGLAVAAAGMALATFIYSGMSITTQVVVFSVCAVIASWVYFTFFRTIDPRKNKELHNNVQNMKGTQFELQDALKVPGQIRTQINDTRWAVVSKVAIAKGTTVQVVGGKGTVLEIEPI